MREVTTLVGKVESQVTADDITTTSGNFTTPFSSILQAFKDLIVSEDAMQSDLFKEVISAQLDEKFYPGTAVILLQEMDQESKLLDGDQGLKQFEETTKITLDNVGALTDCSELVGELSITASAQSWVITPNHLSPFYEAGKVCKNYHLSEQLNTNFLVTEATDRFDDEVLMRTMTESFNCSVTNTTIDSLELQSCGYVLAEQTTLKSNNCNFELVNEVGNKKYLELANSVKNQVIDSITLNRTSHDGGLEIDLHPASLGKMKIKYQMKDQEVVSVMISAEKITTLSLLQQHAQEIKEAIIQNLNSETPTDLSFSMQKHDKNSTHSHTTEGRTLDVDLDQDQKQLVVYLAQDGGINLIV